MTSQPINNGPLAFQLNSSGLSTMGNCQVLWPVNNGYNPLNDVQKSGQQHPVEYQSWVSKHCEPHTSLYDEKCMLTFHLVLKCRYSDTFECIATRSPWYLLAHDQ